MENKNQSRAGHYLELSKLKIMIPVSFTGFTGYFILKPELSPSILIVTAGILFLAIAASVMNQIQEKDIDSLMPRTRNRPLPKGRITLRNAQIYFFSVLLAGTLFLSIGGNFTATLLGLFTVVWYNGVYTNAKRLTPYAFIPGSLTGALPPIIGWVAAGGNIFDITILLTGLLFFIGQIPHFLLLVMKYGNEYVKAGIPSVSQTMSHSQISRITFLSTAAAVIASLFLGLSVFYRREFFFIDVVASLFLLIRFSGLLQQKINGNNYRKYFNSLDGYFLLIMVLIILDRLLPLTT